ncbi:MAG: oligosaccharide flippase family protein, partial [Firmicutes bacterium]|nr:oligosaccharide flippase family protein [Bacillota bacterium]
MEGKRLLKKTGLYFIGNISSKILTFILVPIYALYIKSEDLGYYDYTQTVMNIAVPVFFVAIWESVLKFVLQEDDREKKEKVLATSALFTIVMCIVTALVAIIYNLISSEPFTHIHYVVLMILSYAVMFIWQYYARSLEENKIYVLTGMLGTTVNFLANIIMIFVFHLSIDSLFVSYILGNLSIAVILESKLGILKRINSKNLDIKVLKEMLLFSAPLVLNLISTWLLSGFGRMIINDRFGNYHNGLYAFANRFAIVITMLGSVINMAIIEEALISAKKEGIGKGFINTIETLFRLFQSMIIAAAPLITIFYFVIKLIKKDTDFYDSVSYFPGLLLYSFFMIMTTSFGTVFQVINKTKYQFITTAIGAAATVIISYAAIGRFALHGIIAAQIIGSVVMLLSRYIFINKYVSFKINWFPIIIMLAVYCILSVICLYSDIKIICILAVLSIIA